MKKQAVLDEVKRLNRFNDDLLEQNKRLYEKVENLSKSSDIQGNITRYKEQETTSTETTKDNINHPIHYKSHPSGIECIEIVRHMNFNRGNAIKYIWRAGQKQDELHDLGKAIWYLKDEIERVKNAR